MRTAAYLGGLALRRLAFVLAVAVGLAGCAGSGGGEDIAATPSQVAAAGGAQGAAPVAPDSDAYTLGPGDRLTITVFGHPDLSGEFQVGSTGAVSLPLIGDVPASGRTLGDLEKAIVDKLEPEYLRDPTVSAQVLEYRLFYVIGEVANPGGYPYVSGMRAVNAIALAGGYTYRADKGDLLIRRAGGGKPEPANPNTIVRPGDTVEVPERFF